VAQHVFHYLDVMPSSGAFSKWIEHSHFIILIAIPSFHWIVYVLWAGGVWCYLDDVFQERLRAIGKEKAKTEGVHPWMYYKSPLHRWAERMGLI